MSYFAQFPRGVLGVSEEVYYRAERMSEDNENISVPLEEENYDSAKVLHNMKDTVFRKLFSDPEYLPQLYRSLHPEDKSTTARDLKTATPDNRPPRKLPKCRITPDF